MTSYHKFLIKQRRFCEHEGCIMTLSRATQVRNLNGKDFVYCDKHADRLDLVRRSEAKQERTK